MFGKLSPKFSFNCGILMFGKFFSKFLFIFKLGFFFIDLIKLSNDRLSCIFNNFLIESFKANGLSLFLSFSISDLKSSSSKHVGHLGFTAGTILVFKIYLSFSFPLLSSNSSKLYC